MAFEIGKVGRSLDYLARRGEGGGNAYVRRGPSKKGTNRDDLLRERRLWEEARRDDLRANEQLAIQRGQLDLGRRKEGREVATAQASALMGAQQQQFNQAMEAAGLDLQRAKSANDVLETMQKAIQFAMTSKDGQTPFGDAYPANVALEDLRGLMQLGHQVLSGIGGSPQDHAALDAMASGGGGMALPGGTTPPPRAPGEPSAPQGPEAAPAKPAAGDLFPDFRRGSAITEKDVAAATNAAFRDLPSGAEFDFASGTATDPRTGKVWTWDGSRWTARGEGVTRAAASKPTSAPRGPVGDRTADAELSRVIAVPR